jgi:hypothetical protein
MNLQTRPKLYPPQALLARKPRLSLAFSRPAETAALPHRELAGRPAVASTLAPHELRRIVAGMIG